MFLTGIPMGGFRKLALSCWANGRTESSLCVAIRAAAITTRKGVRSLLKKLFFGETKKSFQFVPTHAFIALASARPVFQYASTLLLVVIAVSRPVSAP